MRSTGHHCHGLLRETGALFRRGYKAILYKWTVLKVFVVISTLDNTSFFAALLRSLGQLSSQTNLILTDRDMLEGRDIAMQVRKIVKMCVFFLVSLDES